MTVTIKRIVAALTTILLALMPLSAIGRGQDQITDQTKGNKKIRPALTSIYTDFARQCRTLQEPTDRNLTLLRTCSGVAGYRFLLEWDDDVLTITMVTPKGKKFDLGLRETFINVKPYADLRAKAEWRVMRSYRTFVPVGVILRVEPMNDMSTNDRPFLAIAKITNQEICITDKITPGANENAEGRHAADLAASKPCLKAAN